MTKTSHCVLDCNSHYVPKSLVTGTSLVHSHMERLGTPYQLCTCLHKHYLPLRMSFSAARRSLIHHSYFLQLLWRHCFFLFGQQAGIKQHEVDQPPILEILSNIPCHFSYPGNLTPPTRASQLYATSFKEGRGGMYISSCHNWRRKPWINYPWRPVGHSTW